MYQQVGQIVGYLTTNELTVTGEKCKRKSCHGNQILKKKNSSIASLFYPIGNSTQANKQARQMFRALKF